MMKACDAACATVHTPPYHLPTVYQTSVWWRVPEKPSAAQ